MEFHRKAKSSSLNATLSPGVPEAHVLSTQSQTLTTLNIENRRLTVLSLQSKRLVALSSQCQSLFALGFSKPVIQHLEARVIASCLLAAAAAKLSLELKAPEFCLIFLHPAFPTLPEIKIPNW